MPWFFSFVNHQDKDDLEEQEQINVHFCVLNLGCRVKLPKIVLYSILYLEGRARPSPAHKEHEFIQDKSHTLMILKIVTQNRYVVFNNKFVRASPVLAKII